MGRTLLVFAVIAIQFASAANASPFTFTKEDRHKTRYYSGQAPLKGHFVALWEISEFDDRPKPEPYLVVRLMITKDAGKILPALPRGEALVIWLRNKDQALNALLSPAQAARIKAHEVRRIEGDAEITITSLQMGVTCDRWGFSAEVASASTSAIVVATQGPDEVSSGACAREPRR